MTFKCSYPHLSLTCWVWNLVNQYDSMKWKRVCKDTYRRAGMRLFKKRMPYNNNTDIDINYLTLKNGKLKHGGWNYFLP